MRTLTLHKGGAGEREIAITAIDVPDLWHVAMHHLDAADLTKHDECAQHMAWSKMILNCWHLAHAMKDHLQAQSEPSDRIVIQRKESTRDQPGLLDSDIVLCFLPENATTPFVTWMQTLDKKPGDGTARYCRGHYCESLEEALQDYATRR